MSCPICGREVGLPEWARGAIVEAVEVGVAAARAESATRLDDAISLAEYLLSYAPPFERKRALDTIAELRGLG